MFGLRFWPFLARFEGVPHFLVAAVARHPWGTPGRDVGCGEATAGPQRRSLGTGTRRDGVQSAKRTHEVLAARRLFG